MIKTKLDSTTGSRWLIGIAGTWIILTAMVEFGDTEEIAVALAVLIMGTALFTYGPDAFKNLGLATGYGGKLKEFAAAIVASPVDEAIIAGSL